MQANSLKPFISDLIARYGGTIKNYRRQQPVYLQGERAGELFYILSGKAFVTISTEDGKQALIAVLQPDYFFGEDCVDAERERNSAVIAATDCTVAAFRSDCVLQIFKNEPDFLRYFSVFLMERNRQLKASLVDQMLLSSEKRLARLLLKFVPSDEEVEPDLAGISLNQDMIASMVGTTRSRINEFMNKFRNLGHIDYSNGHLKVRKSLKSILANNEMLGARTRSESTGSHPFS